MVKPLKSMLRKINTWSRFLVIFYQKHSLTICSLTFLPRDTKCNREENAEFAEHSIFVESKALEVQVMQFSWTDTLL